jgi:hypothetical protein
MQYPENEKLHRGCKMSQGNPLLCSRCKNQVYCNKDCQRKDYRRYEAVCRTPEFAKEIRERHLMWSNTFYVPTGASNGVAPVSLMVGLAVRLNVPAPENAA